MSKKPGIAPYNLLKGQVMELGYVTEQGVKVRVRSLPADGLDRVVMNNIMNNIARDLCEAPDPSAFGLAMANRSNAHKPQGNSDNQHHDKNVKSPGEVAKDARNKFNAADARQKQRAARSLARQNVKEESEELSEAQIDLIEQIQSLSEEEFDDFVDSLDEGELTELNDLMELHSLKAGFYKAAHKATSGLADGRKKAGGKYADSDSERLGGLAKTLRAKADYHSRRTGAAQLARGGAHAGRATVRAGKAVAKAAGPAAKVVGAGVKRAGADLAHTTVLPAALYHTGRYVHGAIKGAASVAKKDINKNFPPKAKGIFAKGAKDGDRMNESYGYDAVGPGLSYSEPHTPRHHEEDIHSYVSRAAKALKAHHDAHPTNSRANLTHKECAFYIAHNHLHPGKDLSKAENAGAANDVLNAAMGHGAADNYEPKYAHIMARQYHKKLRNVD